jgi:hypothetical protein
MMELNNIDPKVLASTPGLKTFDSVFGAYRIAS